MSRPSQRCSRQRRAVVVLITVITLVVVAAVASSLLHRAIERRLAVRRERFRDQAAWLAQAGLHRAAARLLREPEYAGETWRPTAAELSGPHDARVDIYIKAAPAGGKQIVVRADYPDHDFHRARQSAQATVLPAEAGEGI